MAAARLLGRSVERRPHGRALAGKSLWIEDPAGDAEIKDACVGELPAHQEDVARLDVAVDDSALVRGGQRLQHRKGQVRDRRGSQRATRQALFQGFSLKPLHGNEG